MSHVSPRHPAKWPAFPASGAAWLLRSNLQTARTNLAKMAARVEQAGVHITTDVREGAPDDEIVTAARQFGADLIVMATHGRSGLPPLLLGSVAERVVRKAICPVLAFRAVLDGHADTLTHARQAGTVA